MAQALAVGQIIKAQIWASDSEQASVNTFHYRVNGLVSTPPLLTDFLDAFENLVSANFPQLLTDSAHYDGCTAQIVFPLPLMVGEKNSTGNAGGTAGTNGQGRQIAGLIGWTTPLAGPGGRGRTYLPFVSTDDSETTGKPNAGYISKAGNFAVAVSTYVAVTGAGGSADISLGIRHGNTSSFTAFTGGGVQTKWATQKRRGSYGRPNASPF